MRRIKAVIKLLKTAIFKVAVIFYISHSHTVIGYKINVTTPMNQLSLKGWVGYLSHSTRIVSVVLGFVWKLNILTLSHCHL